MRKLDQIKIVMVETTHSGNIGSAARALKTMGLSNLCVVAPKCEIDDQCRSLASSAVDIIEQVEIVDSLDDAIADCELVIGASARDRQLSWPQLTARQCGEQAIAATGKVAILFGRESSGLTNDELQKCHYHVHIQANPDYSSLNIASAIQVIAYECRMAALAHTPDVASNKEPLAKAEQIEGFYQHLEKVLVDIEFLDPNNPRLLMPKMRRLFARALLEVKEVNILRGILTQIDKHRK